MPEEYYSLKIGTPVWNICNMQINKQSAASYKKNLRCSFIMSSGLF